MPRSMRKRLDTMTLEKQVEGAEDRFEPKPGYRKDNVN